MSQSPSPGAGVYVQGTFSEPMSAQHNFGSQYNLEQPDQAMSVYARIMHEHTKQQLVMATNSQRRRSQDLNPSNAR